MFDTFLQGVRHAARSLRRTPGFTAAAIVTLALGVGGSTVIFSVVDGILLRPLPYPDPDRIVTVRTARGAGRDEAHTPADFLELQRDNQSLAHLAGYTGAPIDITGAAAEPTRLDGAIVTAAFFDVFGVPAAHGRVFSADQRAGERLLVLGDGSWRTHFGADPDVIGRPVRMNGEPYVISAIMPPGFEWPEDAEAWALSPIAVPPPPVDLTGNPIEEQRIGYIDAVARLRHGVSPAQAHDDLGGVAHRLAERHASNVGRRYTLVPIREALTGDVRPGLLLLFGSVACVLLIACANVAGLLVARGAGRQREVGIRTALGAQRRRIVWDLLAESTLLSLAGGALGLLLAFWGTHLFVTIMPEALPRLGEINVDLRVATFALAVSVLTGLLFGMAPVVQSSQMDVAPLLRDGTRTAGSPVMRRIRALLVTAEVAVALVLLVAAGLMINSFARLRSVDPGYALDGIVTAFVPLPGSTYGTVARQSAFYRQLLERLQTSPVMSSSGALFPPPFGDASGTASFELEHAAPMLELERPQAQLSIVSPGTFSALGIRVMAGRTFTDRDVDEAPGVVVVNQALANTYWPGDSPIGKRITLDRRQQTERPEWRTVVGVVSDTRPRSLDLPPQPTLYFPYEQFSLPYLSIVVRGTNDTAAVARELRTHLRSLDPGLPIDNVQTLAAAAAGSTAQPRFRTYVLATFASISLLLTAVGLYGLLSYSVTQREREIGVRMSLGARPADVLRLVVGEAMRVVTAGALIGIALAIAVGRLLSTLLFDISATDPLTYTVVVGLLGLVAAVACGVPALRAARVSPTVALRAE